jgi:hypothetical protein
VNARKPASKEKAAGKKYFDLFDDEEDELYEEVTEVTDTIAPKKPEENLAIRPVDDNPLNLTQAYSPSVANDNSYTPTVAEDSTGFSDDSSPVINDSGSEEVADVAPPPPGPNCLENPTAPACVAAATGGGSGAPQLCDPNNPASECYVEPDVCAPGLMLNPVQGSYIKNPTVNLSPTHSCVTNMYYCVQEGGGCCDPINNGTDYTQAFVVSEEDLGVQDNGTFCVSVVAKGDNGDLSPLYEYKYVVDDTSPDMVATFSQVVRIQSSEANNYVQIDSANYGQPGYAAYIINSFDDNPTSLGKSCDEVVNDYPPVSNALRSPAGNIVESLEPLVTGVDTLKFFKSIDNFMVYERNYLTAFVTYTDPVGDQLNTCQQAPQPVEVFDFAMFATTPVGNDRSPANTDGFVEFQASFNDFGFFDVNGGDTYGSGRNNANDTTDCGSGPGNCHLETGYMTIVN